MLRSALLGENQDFAARARALRQRLRSSVDSTEAIRAARDGASMITSLRLIDFKNFADETLRVGPFTVIVGANASGKSNIRDAFRFLHGVGRGYTPAEIYGGKYGAGGQMEWESIRGAANEIIRINKSTHGLPVPANPGFGLAIELTVDGETFDYAIEVSREIGKSGFRITYERLLAAGETVYEKPRSKYGDRKITIGNDHSIDIQLDRPALVQMLETRRILQSERERVQSVVDSLASMRFMDFTPDWMRAPAFPNQTKLGDQGQNLPAVLKEICADPKRKKILADWIDKLTPMDVRGFEFPSDPSGAYSSQDTGVRHRNICLQCFGRHPALPHHGGRLARHRSASPLLHRRDRDRHPSGTALALAGPDRRNKLRKAAFSLWPRLIHRTC